MFLEPLAEWIGSIFADFMINIVWGLTLGIWYIEKAVAWLVDQIVSGDAWRDIVITITDSLATIMPDTLRSVLYGTGGGLFYLALMFVSFTLIVPWLIKQGNKMGELQRLLGWTMLISVLFISSTVGYGLFGLIETARMDIMADLSGGWGGGQLSALVARPMSATDADINVNEFVLPAAFEAEYFPDPAGYETREIVFYDAPLFLGTLSSTVNVETVDSRRNRQAQASLGILLVTLNLVPLSMVIILGASFAALTATALVLLLFLMISLPMGVFEVGEQIIYQIFARYILVWILTIFVAIFPAILLGVAELTLAPPVTLEGLFTYVSILLVAVYAVFHIGKWVMSIAGESFSVIGNSINAAVAPYAHTTAPTADRLPPEYVGQIAGAAGLAGLGAYGAIGAAHTLGYVGTKAVAHAAFLQRAETGSATPEPRRSPTQAHVFQLGSGSAVSTVGNQFTRGAMALEDENPIEGVWVETGQLGAGDAQIKSGSKENG